MKYSTKRTKRSACSKNNAAERHKYPTKWSGELSRTIITFSTREMKQNRFVIFIVSFFNIYHSRDHRKETKSREKCPMLKLYHFCRKSSNLLGAQLPRSLNSEISQIPRSNELDTRYRVPGITVPAHSPEDPRLTSTANFGGGEEPRQREFESVFPGGRGTMPRNYSFACDRSSANDSAVCGRIDGCDITIC